MSSHSVRQTWTKVRLGDVGRVVSGATPRTDNSAYWDGDIRWASPKDLSGREDPIITETAKAITAAGLASCSAEQLPVGTVLFSSRAPIGLTAITGAPMATNQGFKSVVPGAGLDPHFLYWALRHLGPSIADRAPGTTFKEVNKAAMEDVRIPLPPLPEQRRIAALLDKADAIRRKRQQAIRLADDLIQSLYVAIVGPANPDYIHWPIRGVEQLADPAPGSMRTGPFGSALRHSEFVDEGIAVLGIDNAVQNRFVWAERRFITSQKYTAMARYTVKPGDVIITIMGTTGRSAVVPNDVPVAISTKHLATITVDRTRVHPEFLSNAIHRDPLVVGQLQARNRGAIMSGLNLGLIRSLELRLPPLSTQGRFAAAVDAARRSEARYRHCSDTADRLFRVLTQQAFQTP